MNRKNAERLLTVDIQKLSPDKLRTYKVQLLDAWRYAKGDYGMDNDFFVHVPELRAYVPANYWLLKNIENKLDEPIEFFFRLCIIKLRFNYNGSICCHFITTFRYFCKNYVTSKIIRDIM